VVDKFDETTGFLGASQKSMDAPMEESMDESPPKASSAFPKGKKSHPLAGQKQPAKPHKSEPSKKEKENEKTPKVEKTHGKNKH
jgi:hypothetical protein